MTFFVFFFQSFSVTFFLNFPTLYLDNVRVLSRIANLASKYNCSNPCSFRDMAFFVILKKSFSEKLNHFFFTF